MAIKKFNRKQILIDVNEKTREGVIKLALGIDEGLQKTTPVDTGFAVSNWVPSIGNPFVGEAGDRNSISGTEAAAGRVSLLGWDVKKGQIHITNNVKYINKLNSGHSKKAPAGFVEEVIQKQLLIANRGKLN